MAQAAKRAARSTRNNGVLTFVARLGFAVNGVLHALIGIIAISIALGVGSGAADQSGALAALAATPGGVAALWIMFVGLAGLGVWLIVNAFLTLPRGVAKRAGHLISELGKGAVYLALAVTTFTFASGGSANSAQSSTQVSASLLATPGGVFIVVLIGAVIVAIGIYFVVKGVTRRFLRDLSLPAGRAGRVAVALGIIGYVAKGVVLVVVGVLFWVAAATVDPAASSGLDGGLRALATLPFGSAILVTVGLGLIAYAVYGFARARYARL